MAQTEGILTNAGYNILASEAYQSPALPNGDTFGIALGVNPTNGTAVTWEYRESSTGERDYFWGHYHPSERSARKDYHLRLTNYL